MRTIHNLIFEIKTIENIILIDYTNLVEHNSEDVFKKSIQKIK